MASLPHNSFSPARSESISASPELVPLPASPSPSTNSSPAGFTNSTPSSSRQSPLGPVRSRTPSRSPEDPRRVRELSAPQQGSRSVSATSLTRLDPSSTSALHDQTSLTRIDREKSPSKWFGRVSTSSSSSSSVATTNSESTSPAIKTRSSRSRSIGSLNLLTNALSPKAPSPSSKSRPITPPSPTRPSTHSQAIVSSPDSLPSDNRPRSSPPIHQPPTLLETRRGSSTSTNSSHSSALLHFATSLKPTRSHSQPTSRRKQSGDSGGGEVLEEWADAGLEEGDEEGRAISEEMVRVTTSRSNGSSPVASIISKENTNDGGGGGGKFVQSLRRTRSKLALLGKGKEVENNNAAPISIPAAAGSNQVGEDPMMVQSPVLTFVEPPSPSESRTFYQDQEEPSQSFLDLGGGGGASSPSSSPRTSSFIVPPSQGSSTSASGRFGGWFSSMLHNSTSSAQLNLSSSPSSGTSPSPLSSPEKPRQRGGSSPTYLASPTKKSSTSSLSLPPGSSLPSSASTSRLGPLDRMLDKAVQYFLDTDSNADKCEEEIWVLGVRHEGWRPATGAEGIEEDGRDERMPVTEGTTSGATKSVGRRWSPVKSRAAKRQQQQQRTRETSNEGRQSRDESPSPSLHSVSTNFSGDSLSPSIPPASSPTTINGWPASFYLDFYSRPALTYRTNFPLIPCSPSNSGGTMHGMLNTLSLSIGRGSRNHNREESGLSSDTGWGCMLRTGQSLLANALVTAHLGRDWRRPLPPSPLPPSSAHGQPAPPLPSPILPPSYPTYTRLLSLFLDTPAPSSPFSIHKFALEGQRLGKSVGEWFGPSTAAGAIKKLVNDFEPAGMQVVSCIDGTVYENEVIAAGTREKKWDTKVLVLINLRLGIDGVNPIYHEAIKGIFRIPQSVGIAGGRPSSSYYFVGSQANSLFYIDPHHPRPAVPVIDIPSEVQAATCKVPLAPSSAPDRLGDSFVTVAPAQDRNRELVDTFFSTAYEDSAWTTYHCDKVRKCSLSSLDPSMLVGFLIQDEQDWEDFKIKARELGQNSSAIFSIAPSPPKWMRRSSSTGLTSNAVAAATVSASPGDDSFSEFDEDSIVDRPSATADQQGTEGETVDAEDDFSDPEGWELDSTDASETNSLREGEEEEAISIDPPSPQDKHGEEGDPIFVDSHSSLPPSPTKPQR